MVVGKTARKTVVYSLFEQNIIFHYPLLVPSCWRKNRRRRGKWKMGRSGVMMMRRKRRRRKKK